MKAHVTEKPRACRRCGDLLPVPRSASVRLHRACLEALRQEREYAKTRAATGAPRAQTLQAKRHRGEIFLPVDESLFVDRPATCGDCLEGGRNVERPCPWVGCVHHLYLEVTSTGNLKLNFPDKEVDELKETCALDVADAGGSKLDEIGQALNITRERVRQVKVKALLKLRRHGVVVDR